MITRVIAGLFLTAILASCVANDADNAGTTAPIDSTNMYGTAPAQYGGDDPAEVQDGTATDVDTGGGRRPALTTSEEEQAQ